MKKILLFCLFITHLSAFCQKPKNEIKSNAMNTLYDASDEWNQIIEINMEKNTKILITTKAAPLLLKLKEIDVSKKVDEAITLYNEVNDNKTEYDGIRIVYKENFDSAIEWSTPKQKTIELYPSISNVKKFAILSNEEVVKIKTTKDTLELIFQYDKSEIKTQSKKLSENDFFLKFSFILNDINNADSLEFNKIKASINDHIEKFESRFQKILDNPAMKYAATSKIDTKNMRIYSGKGKNKELNINTYMGLGLIRDRFVPEISSDFMYRINRKYAFGIGIHVLYFWQKATEEKNYKLNSAQFISLRFNSYSQIKTSAGVTSKLNSGLELGHFYEKDSRYFNNNTFRLGASIPASKNILVQPQLYFNYFFKNAFPAIKLQMGF